MSTWLSFIRETVTIVTKWAVGEVQRPLRYLFGQEENVVQNHQENVAQDKQGEVEIVRGRRLLGAAIGHYHIDLKV